MSRQAITEPWAKASTPVRGGVLQRKCACGQHAGGGECEECQKKKQSLQRKEGSVAEPVGVPPVVHQVLRSPGQPLDLDTRAFMESRFGHDFGQVRVHRDEAASRSAQEVNALAYTVGQHIVFRKDHYQPSAPQGRSLLAHELTHVVQQGHMAQSSRLALASSSSELEKEADAVAFRVLAGASPGSISTYQESAVRRKMNVHEPDKPIPNPGGKGVVQTNAVTVENYLSTLCPGGGAKVDPISGTVGVDKGLCKPISFLGVPVLPSPAELSRTPTSCGCICDLVGSANKWTIKIDDASWPHTLFDDEDGADGKKPGGTGGTVTAPSPNSPKLWGTATASGKELDIDPWLVLGHELCGHGWLGDKGRHGPDKTSPRGEGGHQETVARENELRKEHGIELRGTFKEPNCGESYWRDKKKPGKVNWSSFRAVCEKWRKEYNKKNKTNFKITDTIP